MIKKIMINMFFLFSILFFTNCSEKNNMINSDISNTDLTRNSESLIVRNLVEDIRNNLELDRETIISIPKNSICDNSAVVKIINNNQIDTYEYSKVDEVWSSVGILSTEYIEVNNSLKKTTSDYGYLVTFYSKKNFKGDSWQALLVDDALLSSNLNESGTYVTSGYLNPFLDPFKSMTFGELSIDDHEIGSVPYDIDIEWNSSCSWLVYDTYYNSYNYPDRDKSSLDATGEDALVTFFMDYEKDPKPLEGTIEGTYAFNIVNPPSYECDITSSNGSCTYQWKVWQIIVGNEEYNLMAESSDGSTLELDSSDLSIIAPGLNYPYAKIVCVVEDKANLTLTLTKYIRLTNS